ncbi:UDP-glucose/GDP-mannose dehydrogenase family protein [Halomonas desiderata]|uniref:UDP-glucose 6-dehydrogenase n=1 Tax=Billgrantia desiderata TaxID=52021 RepID=A0AAW4YXE5_9GAMM|nr:UDP-glucose/GDP-mannose dehydrogenase family protein [Halomonas desiderata]MCE8011162.1 UDP-glucose/GDP-mannose dehydrogenase family protein [Halomonas desiderata]MCE8041737.1 UDP-glucose/GDP-mannose dehydrogenase family protein [Halomonas desiderata]MCE8046312.1 UDP-glucose/GDP-mannose dehydrogenase family protein [Halomonas desiderata]MCE8052949.1 UDP-glucose/GDP-mannose dehydrogenase family protein [Halomonas desiderata]NIC38054.1 UDP-glucose/GDP-mannose dehydrogenase family protein [Hal
MKVTIFGTGYVGLVTGTCLADVGHDVMCVDVDVDKIARLRDGEVTIYEPGLEEMVKRNLASGRLRFTTDPAEGVAFATLQFIAVGTPSDEDGSADLQYVLAVAETIGRHMREYKVVVDKSTVPVGTADRVRTTVANKLAARGEAIDFDVCANPEFLKEGAAIEDFTSGARIVVGTDAERVKELMRECYAPYSRLHDKLMFMDVRSAELTKYAANAMLATKISFMNEMANLAERLGADVEQVRVGIGSDPRIGYQFIYPGCGYGGSCFPKDVQALARSAAEVDYPTELLNAVEAVNRRQKQSLFQKLCVAFDGELEGKTIALWGLAFKPETDDMRDAPSRTLMEAVWKSGGRVQAFDPQAMKECRRIYGERDDLMLVADRIQAVKGADALVICTEWKEFRTVDFEWLKANLSKPVIVDGRNLFNPRAVKRAGLRYFAVGRGDSLKASQG